MIGDWADVDTDGPLEKGETREVDPNHVEVWQISKEITPHTLQWQEDLERLQQTAICKSTKVPVETTEAQQA